MELCSLPNELLVLILGMVGDVGKSRETCKLLKEQGTLAVRTLDLSRPWPLGGKRRTRETRDGRVCWTEVEKGDVAAVLSRMVNLTHLVAWKECGLLDLDPVSSLKALRVLKVRHDRWERRVEVDLAPLASCGLLGELVVRGARVGNLGSLAACESLHTLDLYDTAFDARDLVALQACKALRHLDLSGSSIDDLALLSPFGALQTLILKACVSIVDLGPLASHTALERLDVSSCSAALGPLARLTALRDLDVSRCDWTVPLDVGQLCRLTALRVGRVHGAPDGVEVDLAALAACSLLGELDVSGSRLTNVGTLSSCESLHTLDLSGTDVDAHALVALHSCRALRSLDISGCALDDLALLSPFTALQTLAAKQCGSIVALGPLATHTALQSLNLSWCTGVTDLGPLASLTALKCLRLHYFEGVTDLGPLASLASAQRLTLSLCAGVTDLGPLARLTALQRLTLSLCNGVSDLGPLAHLTALRRLTLSSCPEVSDLGPLARLTALRRLKVSVNDRITCLGLAPLASLTALRRLNLAGLWRVTDLGALAPLTALKHLDLSNVPVADLYSLASCSDLLVVLFPQRSEAVLTCMERMPRGSVILVRKGFRGFEPY